MNYKLAWRTSTQHDCKPMDSYWWGYIVSSFSSWWSHIFQVWSLIENKVTSFSMGPICKIVSKFCIIRIIYWISTSYRIKILQEICVTRGMVVVFSQRIYVKPGHDKMNVVCYSTLIVSNKCAFLVTSISITTPRVLAQWTMAAGDASIKEIWICYWDGELVIACSWVSRPESTLEGKTKSYVIRLSPSSHLTRLPPVNTCTHER